MPHWFSQTNNKQTTKGVSISPSKSLLTLRTPFPPPHPTQKQNVFVRPVWIDLPWTRLLLPSNGGLHLGKKRCKRQSSMTQITIHDRLQRKRGHHNHNNNNNKLPLKLVETFIDIPSKQFWKMPSCKHDPSEIVTVHSTRSVKSALHWKWFQFESQKKCYATSNSFSKVSNILSCLNPLKQSVSESWVRKWRSREMSSHSHQIRCQFANDVSRKMFVKYIYI